MEPQALFFQFEADDRTRRICRFMRRSHISCVFVERPDYLQTLGALAALPGFAKTADYYMGAPLADEMLVFSGISSELINILHGIEIFIPPYDLWKSSHIG